VTISSTFYEQLLHVQISKAQKKTDNWTVFFVLSGSVCVKAARKMLVNWTTDREREASFKIGICSVGIPSQFP